MASKRLSIISPTLNCTIYLLIIALTTIGCANSARTLLVGDATSPVPAVPPEEVDVTTTTPPVVAPAIPVTTPAVPLITPAAPADAPVASVPTTPAPVAVVVAPVSPPNALTTPVSSLAPAAGPTATQPGVVAGAGSGGAAASLSFFMHDILGGSQPSGRVVAGIVANLGVNSQLPFSRPNTAVLPINGGIPLLNNGNNINGLINDNNIPYLAGLGGSSSTTVIGNSGNNNAINGGNKLPFVDAGQLPAGATLQKLMFGTVTVIDDELTEGQDLGSSVVGKAQGFYLASSMDGTSQTMALTALFHGGDNATDDTISFFGVHRTASQESQVAVVGGTGKYENAKGYANIQTLHPTDQHTTDGVETLLQFSAYLSY